MKKVYIILLTLVFFQFNKLFSENWEPFPLNQTSYYKITKAKYLWIDNIFESKDLIDAITIIKFDSVTNQNSNNKKYYSQIIKNNDKCLLSKQDTLWDKYDHLQNLQPKSYIFVDDTLVFLIKDEHNISNTCLKLPLNLDNSKSYFQINYDSNFNSTMKIETKLISKTEKSIFGIKDSIITFEIQRRRVPEKEDGTFIIELSKTFGLIKYFPLDILFNWSLSAQIQEIELASVDKNQEHYGEVYDFKYRNRNLFEKPRNIKIYRDVWGVNSWDYVFIRDSIISVDNSEDFVFVVYNRQTLSSNQGVKPNININYTYTYLKKDSIIYEGFNAMVDALRRGETFIPSAHLFDKVPNNETKQIDDSLEVIATPLLFKFVDKCGHKDLQIFYVFDATLDRENCFLQNRFFVNKILDYKMDLWWEINNYGPWRTDDLYIGFKDGDCEWGDLSWPPKEVSVSQEQQYHYQLFPNPVRSTTRVNLQQEGQVAITAVDLLGHSFPLWSGYASTGTLELDVSTLPTGSYTLLIDYGTKREAVRMMKE